MEDLNTSNMSTVSSLSMTSRSLSDFQRMIYWDLMSLNILAMNTGITTLNCRKYVKKLKRYRT